MASPGNSFGAYDGHAATRREIDQFVADRDSALMQRVARVGQKLYETDAYAIWRVKP